METRPLQVKFYRQISGKEPVREWLKSLSDTDKKSIGEDIKTAQWGWPLGMPLVRNLKNGGLWEIRTNLDNRISRVIFCMYEANIILLHGFIKKTQKTPNADIELAKRRMLEIKGGYYDN